jgi:hypothetical protein
MTELVACLSTGKGTWVDVIKLLKSEKWDTVFLITNQFGKDNYKADEKTGLVVLDDRKSADMLVKDIIASLTDKLIGPEIAVNLISGSGKEHMAVISALLKMGYGIRLVHVLNDKVEEV